MARKTLIELAAPTMYGPGGAPLSIAMAAVTSAGKLAFQATFKGANGDFTVCDDGGKTRTFRDADDVFTQAGALSMVADDVTVQFSNMSLVAPKPFTGDIIKKSQSMVASYTKRKANAAERLTSLDRELQLMASDPTVPQSRRDETAAQKVAVQALSGYLDAEITRINAILNA